MGSIWKNITNSKFVFNEILRFRSERCLIYLKTRIFFPIHMCLMHVLMHHSSIAEIKYNKGNHQRSLTVNDLWALILYWTIILHMCLSHYAVPTRALSHLCIHVWLCGNTNMLHLILWSESGFEQFDQLWIIFSYFPLLN